MREIKHTVEFKLNGKDVKIRFFEDPEIIRKINEDEKSGKEGLYCNYCELRELCASNSLKDPLVQDDPDYSFIDFCLRGSMNCDDFLNNKSFITLDYIREKKPEFLEKMTEYFEKTGKKSITPVELLISTNMDAADLMPCPEDVLPLIEYLKK
jgi:hypothetical protein